MSNQEDQKIKKIRDLINLNQDARQYFYEKADQTWLQWLWENDFFHVLREKAEDPTRYSYRTPELQYLVRMAKENPEKVVEVVLDTPLSKEAFNPEVVDQFIRICSELPGEQLAKVVEKIQFENWPALMMDYNQWGFDYGKMLKALEESNHFKELLILARAVLGVRSKVASDSHEMELRDKTPFTMGHLFYSNVFQHLAKIPSEFLQETLSLALSTLPTTISLFGDKAKEDSPFAFEDPFHLFDVDFFTLQPRSEYRDSASEDVQELAALIKVLAQRLIGENCGQEAFIEGIYKRYIETLPDSRLIWRLRLFLLTLCPAVFQAQLKKAFFRVFETSRYGALTIGAEYKTALLKAFYVLSDRDKRSYIKNVRQYFSRSEADEEEKYRRREGSRILSMIREHLTETEKKEVVVEGFDISLDYAPKPIIGESYGGWVKAKGPVTLHELSEIPVATIAQNLRSIWSPQKLLEQDKEKDFLSPLNAEGLGELLREDIRSRFLEYSGNAFDFFDRDNLDLHYTYSVLVGFEKAIEATSEPLPQKAWSSLIDYCLAIKQSAQANPIDFSEFEDRLNDTWLGRWNAVHHGLSDLLSKALSKKGEEQGFDFSSHRGSLYSLIEYLFTYPDPVPEDEKLESAKMTESVGSQPALVSDPFMLAINSVRGKAFQLLVSYVYHEGRSFPKESPSKLKTDIKGLYESVLSKEKTRAMMFMFGHYLPTFYFLDKKWLIGNLTRIFPRGRPSRLLYLASWEGFLANNLYSQVFNDPEIRKLYKRAICITGLHYPNQKHFLDPEEGLAQHFALAYMHAKFGFEDDLFKAFWKCPRLERHKAFVNRLGRLYISGENPEANKFIAEDADARAKLKVMWKWLLDTYADNEIFKEFGFWINIDKEVFEIPVLAKLLVLTLNKTGGSLDWDHNLTKNISRLAPDAPEDTLEIARLFLLEGSVRSKQNQLHFLLDEIWKETFTMLHENPITRSKTVSLIDDLIREGGKFFWPLKEVLTLPPT